MATTLAPTGNHTSSDTYKLSAALRLQEKGPEVEREPVTEADLSNAVSELWLCGCLRKGFPDLRLEDLSFRIVPNRKTENSPRCAGFALEAHNPGGMPIRQDFSIRGFDFVAHRPASRLLADGRLKPEDTYYFELVAEPADPEASTSNEDSAQQPQPFRVIHKNPPLRYSRVPLTSLLKQAQAVGEVDTNGLPVFYTTEAHEKAERFALKGAEFNPAIETGAVLVGPLCSCPDTGEFFLVVCEVLEVLDAEQTAFSLAYTSKSWTRIQAVLRVKQANPATAAYRILGQCHGHPFQPKKCEDCDKRTVCTGTSVFVSPDDRLWSRAVFARQPWALCHIFGLNARGERVNTLFGLQDCQWLPRGFYLIPDFDPRLYASPAC